MQTVSKSSVGKNELWAAYEDAAPLVKDEIILDLKKAGLLQHFYKVASVEGYDLKKDHKGKLRDAFMKVLPETAPLFGIDRTRDPAGVFVRVGEWTIPSNSHSPTS